MLALVALPLSALVLLYAFSCYRSFTKNLADAKVSGIPYILAPVYLFNTAWLVISPLLLPLFHKLPKSWTYPWLEVINVEWVWQHRYAIHKNLGTDNFLVVAPGGNIMWCSDADVIIQMTTRRLDFPKPIHMYGMVDIYGKNVVSSEGQMWRHHRKILSPPFKEESNHLVWAESIYQAETMMQRWVGVPGEKAQTISTVAADTMRLSLYVISRAGFGVRLLWPDAEYSAKTQAETFQIAKTAGVSPVGISEGHTMSYTDSIHDLLEFLPWILLVPKYILRNLPFKSARNCHESYVEWGKYMKEMLEAKKAEIATGKQLQQDGLDMLGNLLKSGGLTHETLSASSSLEKGQQPPKQTLSDAEIVGNAFVIILAGHETTANSIHFAVLLLAMKVDSQRRLQADLDSIFQGRPPAAWDYDRDLPKLFGGMAGAVLNEQLRLIPPVVGIPKCTLPGQPRSILINGEKCTVPSGTLINICSASVHRNPKYWPTGPPSHPEDPVHPESNTDNDLEEFKPERWLIDEAEKPSSQQNGGFRTANGKSHNLVPSTTSQNNDTDDLNINTAADTAQTLYRPYKGAYIPFSEGYRACIGRRFAQVEVLAVLAVLFSQYSVELAVDEWASDEEVEKMGTEERREVWGKARRSAMEKMRKMESVITIQLRGDAVPVRWVKRGKERFDGVW